MELLLVAIGLNLIGLGLKQIKFIKDNLIPLILAGIGCAVFGVLYWIGVPIDGLTGVENIFEMGILAASTSVFLHQNLKQVIDLLPVNDKTKEILEDIVDEHVPVDEKES